MGNRVHRHRFIVADPGRFGCLLAAAGLYATPDLPFVLVLLAALVTQLCAVSILWTGKNPGWTRAGGPKAREAHFASGLTMDLGTLAASTLVGALLLARLFGGASGPLALLAVGVCFLPDVRLCRLVLSGDARSASRQLREGWSFRDPVAWGAALTAGAVLSLDAGSLSWVVLSLGLFQLNALLVLFDKYLPEIEAAGWKALAVDRDARRFAVAVSAVALAPLRLLAGDPAASWGAAAIGALIVLPDLYRLALAALRAAGAMFRLAPAPPSTYVMLPKG